MKVPLCTCGAIKKIPQMIKEDKVHHFLMGLDDESYSTIRSGIIALNLLLWLDKIFSMVQ